MKMKHGIIASILALTILASMSGCSNNSKNSSSINNTSSSTSTSAESEKKILVTATAADLNTLFPLNMDAQNNVVDRMVYQGLVTYEDNEVKPLLAESWDIKDDGKTIVFNLKKGVKFHDGTDFNADAVKKCYEFGKLNPNFGSISAVANLENAEVIDDYTVAFHYANPYFAYLKDFCYPEVMIVVSPEVIEEENFSSMKGVIGTGPYIYDEYKTGEYTRFVKNENYWGEQPYYDEIIVKCIPDSSSRLQALQAGEIDMIFGNALVSYDDYEQAISMNGIKGNIAETNSQTRNLVLNASSEKLSDLKVREAIAYAIDKKAISDGITYGFEQVADTLFDKSAQYCNITLNNSRNYDNEKAASLLDEAGWKLNTSTGLREKNGVPLSITFTFNSGEIMNESIALIIKDQLKKVGIDVATSPLDQYSWWMGGVAGEYDITMWNTEQPYTIPHNFYTPIARGSSPHVPALSALNGSDDFIAMINEYKTINDSDRVDEIFSYLQNYSNDNVLDIPLTYIKDVIVYDSNDISGYNFGSTPMFFDVSKLTPTK